MARHHMIWILFLKISFEIVEHMADCKESKVHTEIQMTNTNVKPETQFGIVCKMRNTEADDS